MFMQLVWSHWWHASHEIMNLSYSLGIQQLQYTFNLWCNGEGQGKSSLLVIFGEGVIAQFLKHVATSGKEDKGAGMGIGNSPDIDNLPDIDNSPDVSSSSIRTNSCDLLISLLELTRCFMLFVAFCGFFCGFFYGFFCGFFVAFFAASFACE